VANWLVERDLKGRNREGPERNIRQEEVDCCTQVQPENIDRPRVKRALTGWTHRKVQEKAGQD
jgi:hypothetical protein